MNVMKKARHRGENPAASANPATTVLDGDPFEGDLDAALKSAPKRAKPGPTAYLAIGVVAVAGFIGGVQAHKTWGGEESAAAGPTAMGAPGGRGGQNGQSPSGGPGGGSFGGLTSGTVTKIADGVLYVKTSGGETVQVKISDSTEITVSENGTAEDLKSGTTVVVRGETADDGTVNASTVTEGGGMRQQSGN